MNPLQDVFISYGRADSREFAARLNQRLIESGLEVWFDFDDIPLGVDYQKQIDDGIDKADNFLFIISPHSVNSPYCELEIELALKRNKRILPILHVEEISRETWQQRTPEGTEAEWEAYKAAGKHSHFPNMHAAIRKINWVYFREGIDDFEKSLQDLLALFERDRDYVHQHTVLLSQALTWQVNHQRPQDLLVNEALQAAERWLQTEFRDRQPPCIPTRLHCRFISESLKNAQDGMTEVFLSHAESDRETFEQIYAALTRAGLTVWSNWHDIQTGVDFKEAINRGIETTDNVVYLLSPEAAQSPWCQLELDYAMQLNKRIIPVLIQPLALEAVSPAIAALQFIDLTAAPPEADGVPQIGELLKAIKSEADYYHTHKQLLVQALKWERQLRNPCVLLQGKELNQTVAWLQVAQKRTQQPPLPLQIDFVQTSLQQPADLGLNVFIISHSRDLTFARKLNETLQIQGERTWFETDRVAASAELTTLITQNIERAENVVVVVSVEALADPPILADLQTAQTLSKRVIAVSYQAEVMPLVNQLRTKLAHQSFSDGPSQPEPTALPAALMTSSWVDFCDRDGDFVANFGNLYRILKSHPDHVRNHTRLLMRATSWEQANRDDSALLRPKELPKAEQWLATAADLSPPPADLHKTYLQASRDVLSRKVKPRSVLGVSLGATLLILMARFMGLLQGAELLAYDHLLRQRPNEPQDDRFLTVTIDADSGSYLREGLISERYTPSIGTLPDDALIEVLRILQQNQARLVGLDFYRDFPANPELKSLLEASDNFIAVCNLSQGGTGVQQPSEVDSAQVGFANMAGDQQAGLSYVRRHFLMDGADPPDCDTNTAFNLLLAQRYLAQEGVVFSSPAKPEGGFRGNGMNLGEVVVPNLFVARGPYYNAAELQGYQTLLNFRTAPNPDENIAKDATRFAPQVTLEALLTGQVPRELIADRIVLIGYTDLTDRNADSWDTPYGQMPGVFLHGQKASQLISAALDDRPLLGWWSLDKELLWIAAWAIAGGLLARQLIRWPRLAGGWAIAVVLLYSSCWLAMVAYSVWIPFVPALLTLTISTGGISILSYRLRHP
ncbi:TIR domain-containing protein [Leptolyngbya iicbica]|uniref:TIR domain-containing protein n=2 Tax=Cyanophyceae TaxID=3028117 RepID=A0A4Q7E3M6_9CYAN|nr:TIR domain-containing protein [Leptolyngbya sp. LK]RZM76627.1 TIR domain-containing protein [Leptolyngbya sp. LK]